MELSKKAWIEIYGKANDLYEKNQVTVTNIIEKNEFTKLVFEVKDETVTLKLTPPDNSGPWKREMSCTCSGCGIFGFDNRISCKRRMAVEKYLLELKNNV